MCFTNYNLSVSCHRVDCCQRAGPSHYSAPPAQSGDRHWCHVPGSRLSDRGHWSIANLCIIKNLGTLSVKNKTDDSVRGEETVQGHLDLSFTPPHLSILLCSISNRNMCPMTWDTQLKNVKIVIALHTDQRGRDQMCLKAELVKSQDCGMQTSSFYFGEMER